MENASKALIIAGSILIAILLISVGIMVMNAASAQTDQVAQTTKSQAAQSFNSQFTGYLGKKVTAQEVKALIGAVQASNKADATHKITLTTTTNINDVDTAKKYTVSLAETEEAQYDDDGYITTIDIASNSN